MTFTLQHVVTHLETDTEPPYVQFMVSFQDKDFMVWIDPQGRGMKIDPIDNAGKIIPDWSSSPSWEEEWDQITSDDVMNAIWSSEAFIAAVEQL